MATRGVKWRKWNIAKELGYLSVMPDIKARIYACETENEVSRVLEMARHMMERR